MERHVSVSDHAFERLRERKKWSRSTIERMALKIYESGIRAEDVKGFLRDWMIKKQMESSSRIVHVLYGDIAYVYQESADGGNPILITGYPAPTKNAVVRVREGARRSRR